MIKYLCILCTQFTTMWCSRCQKAWYCSREHLQSDWPRHRRECIPPHSDNNIIAMPPPSESKAIEVSAILFPPEGFPLITSVRCLQVTNRDGTFPMPLLDAYIPEGSKAIVLTQGIGGEPLRFPLHLWYSPTALWKYEPINWAIYHITGKTRRLWCGTVIAFKFSGSRRERYSDAGSNNLPALSAYFLRACDSAT